MDLSTISLENILPALPVIVLVTWATLLLLADLFIERKMLTAAIALAGLLLAGGLLVFQEVSRGEIVQVGFSGMVIADGFALFLQGVILLTTFLGILVAMEYLPRHKIERGEYYTLLLFTTAGMMLMVLANNLIMVFVALELLSIPLYVLTGFVRKGTRSEEAAMKYFLLGAFASGFMVYGIALTYGGTGTTQLSGVVDALQGQSANSQVLAMIGMGLIVVGLGFKVGAVPFHMWTPDVYEGAPTPVTAFMSVGSKIGGFAALLRVLVIAFPDLAPQWGNVIAVIAIITMILGNFVAVSQRDIKRLLAYSSIAHAGYILMAVAAAQNPAVADFAASAAAFYMLTYVFTNIGAFAVAMAVERTDGTGTEIENFAGLSKTHPWLALAMTLFMLSLAGLPPTAGLIGKIFVFQAAVEAASNGNVLMIILAIVGALTSVISAFYYARIILMMYFREGTGEAELRPALGAATALSALGTLLLFVLPTQAFALAVKALIGGG
jgi:NADH-quinone oxidoreductase subunit N